MQPTGRVRAEALARLEVAAIRAAAARIGEHVVRTPLVRNAELDRVAGGRILVKAECLQRTGSFKFRGALNKLLALSEDERAKGVVAFSSGNHALAVAEAALLVGAPAVVVMPGDAPRAKAEGAARRGAEIRFYDRQTEDREAICSRLSSERGLTMVRPFDDLDVIAGQGTAALEAVEQARGMTGVAPIGVTLACCSGGGLAAGWGVAVRSALPQVDVLTVEPEGFDDTARSLATGRPVTNERLAGSICDSLLVPTPSKVTMPILAAIGARGVAVDDTAVLRAMRLAFDHLKLVVEPGGAVALAALLAGIVDATDRTVLIVCSGGNVDPGIFQRCLAM